MRVIHVHSISAALALIILLVTVNAFEQARRWVRSSTPAIEWEQKALVKTPQVAPGGVLAVEYEAKVFKSCPADVRGFLVAADGSVPVRYPVLAGGYTKPSDGDVRIKVNIPIPAQSDPGQPPFRPGPMTYRTIVTRYCPEGIEEDVSVPDVNFNLVVP